MNQLNGLIENLSSEDYHAAPALSASALKDMGESFEYYKWRRDNPMEQTDDMMIGTACHYGVLEPELFKDKVAVLPEGMRRDLRTDAYKEFLASSEGKLVLKKEDFDLVQRMIDSVLGKPEVSAFFQGGIAEASLFSLYPETFVQAKCRPDYLRVADGLSINFKTSNDASHGGFINSIKDFNYDWQSAFYLDMLQAHFKRHFDEIHVVVEKRKKGGPCPVAIYTIDDADLEFARAQYRPLIERYMLCLETDTWPSPPVGVQTITLPNYAKKVVLV